MPRPPLARPRALGASQFQGASSPARCQLSRGHTKPPSPSPPLGLLLLRRLLTLTSSDDAAEETDEPTSQPRSLQDCDAHQRCRNSQWQERGAAPDCPPGPSQLLQRGAVIRCDVGNAQIDYTRNPCTHHADRTSLRQTECRMQHAVLRLFYAIAPSAHSENVRGLRSHCSDGQ